MTSTNQSQSSKNRSIWIKLIKLAVVVLIIYFAYRHLDKNWQDVIAYDWSLNIWLLLLSVVLHLLTLVLLSYIWCFLIQAFGFRVRLIHAFKIAYITNLGRYVPGKILPVLGMSYYAKKLGISEENSVTSWIIAMIFNLPSAFMASFVCILIAPDSFIGSLNKYLDWTVYLVMVIVFVASLALIIIPNKIFLIVNILLKKFKRPTINLQINLKTALIVYLGYFICWLLFGFSFYVFLLAITGNFDLSMITAIGTFIIAYQIGYLAFFAPGGIGVRELIITSILTASLGPIAAGVAVAARVWNLIVEICAFVIALLIKIPSKLK